MTERDKNNVAVLARFLPHETEHFVWQFIKSNKVNFKISNPRKSKLGDFRPAIMDKNHRISVNGNLNKYAFLITTLHEFAHLITWDEYKNKTLPHGKEWKKNFENLLSPFLTNGTFPEDVSSALSSYIQNPAAASCVDLRLSKSLKRYDHKPSKILDDIEVGTKFKLPNGMVFEKGQRVRKRYKCLNLHNKRLYFVSSVAEVEIIDG
ncbi:MAG: SprT-like domain-containing protein [Flavobacteriales bacterium]|nr:SprT-like domain-containing protein [Flavobacteriales bacterium]